MGFYKESKKINFGRMAWSFPLGMLVLFGLAELYAYVIIGNPATFFNFLIAAAYMLFVAVVGTLAIEGAKIRSARIRLISMIVLAVFALCCAWVFHLALIFEVSFFTVLADLQTYFLGLTNELIFKGGVPYFSWIAEAALIISFPIYFIASRADGDKPYCEPCDKWLEDNETILLKLSQIYTLSELVAKIETEGIQSILKNERADEKDGNFYQFTFFWCKTCRDGMYLTVKRHYLDHSKSFDKKESILVMNLYDLEDTLQWEELFEGGNDNEDQFNFAEMEEPELEAENQEDYDPDEFDELEEI